MSFRNAGSTWWLRGSSFRWLILRWRFISSSKAACRSRWRAVHCSQRQHVAPGCTQTLTVVLGRRGAAGLESLQLDALALGRRLRRRPCGAARGAVRLSPVRCQAARRCGLSQAAPSWVRCLGLRHHRRLHLCAWIVVGHVRLQREVGEVWDHVVREHGGDDPEVALGGEQTRLHGSLALEVLWTLLARQHLPALAGHAPRSVACEGGQQAGQHHGEGCGVLLCFICWAPAAARSGGQVLARSDLRCSQCARQCPNVVRLTIHRHCIIQYTAWTRAPSK